MTPADRKLSGKRAGRGPEKASARARFVREVESDSAATASASTPELIERLEQRAQELARLTDRLGRAERALDAEREARQDLSEALAAEREKGREARLVTERQLERAQTTVRMLLAQLSRAKEEDRAGRRRRRRRLLGR